MVRVGSGIPEEGEARSETLPADRWRDDDNRFALRGVAHEHPRPWFGPPLIVLLWRKHRGADAGAGVVHAGPASAQTRANASRARTRFKRHAERADGC